MAKTDETSVVIPEGNNYLAILSDPDMGVAIRENIGGQITPFMLPRLRIPTGGVTQWQVPDASGELIPRKTIEGIIVYSATWRGYWREAFGQGNVFPDCSSRDGVIGVGDPGVECGTCMFNEFGTDNKRAGGRGKACKEMRATFILQPGDVFPSLMLIPPTSLKDNSAYFMNLANKRLPYWKVETGFSLVGDKNADGIQFARVVPRTTRQLNPDEIASVAEYRTNIRAIVDAQPLTRADVE